MVDAADANALYRLLEEEVVPAFYERGADHVPHAWIAIVKESIRTVAPRFCARRMVKEYAERMYAPALERRRRKTRSLKASSLPVSLSLDLTSDFVRLIGGWWMIWTWLPSGSLK